MTRRTTRGGHPYPCGCQEVCLPADRAYAARVRRLKAYGRWQPFTDAGPAREHAQVLVGAGIGMRRIAELAGVTPCAVWNLLSGQPGRGTPPARRIRTETARRILAIRPIEANQDWNARVDATGSRRRVQALVALGWSMRSVAAMMPIEPAYLRAIVRDRPQVTAKTARKVRAAYDQLWDQVPSEVNRSERISAAKARSLAARRGWVPPLAWDDEVIDNPAAQPAPGWKRVKITRSEDLAADVAELEARHYTRAQAAERLGMRRGTLDRALARAARRQETGTAEEQAA